MAHGLDDVPGPDWAVVVVALWALVQAGIPKPTVKDSAEAILKHRYARGDIDRPEYEERLERVREAWLPIS